MMEEADRFEAPPVCGFLMSQSTFCPPLGEGILGICPFLRKCLFYGTHTEPA